MTSTLPQVPLCERDFLVGSAARTSSRLRVNALGDVFCTASCGNPISTGITSPEYSRPGYRRCPLLKLPNVTVRPALTAVPCIFPVSAQTPDAISSEHTKACCSLIHRITSANTPVIFRDRPMPNSASTITPRNCSGGAS